MLIPVPPSECMRAREAASGRLDGELTELEAVRLETHLRRCPDCREFAGQAAAFTEELRLAPLQPLAASAFMPRRRRRVSAVRAQAAAAVLAAAAAAGAFTLGHVLGGRSGPTFAASTPAADLASARADAFEQHLLALLPPARRPHTLRVGGNVVAL